jgi:cytochrome c biogenesis protein ResB
MTNESARARASRPGPLRWLLIEFTRLRLAVWLLVVMAVTMVVGSVFPQGYDAATYIESWGEAKHAALAKWGLLNLFHTRYFIVLGVILLVNLVACSVVRWFGRGGARLSAAGGHPEHARPVALPRTGDPVGRAAGVLAACGYKVLGSSDGVVTARRGPWPEGVSLLYHLALALAIVGFILSALFAFEGEVTIPTGESATAATVSDETGANALATRLAAWSVGSWQPFSALPADTTAWEGREVTLVLNEFVTEWELYQGKYYNRDWVSDLEVTGEDGRTRRALVEVNRPLRVSGLTFYQMAYDQWFDVVVRKDGVEVERADGQAYAPFMLESVSGMFFPGPMRVGTLFEKHREPAPVTPHVPLKWQAADAPEDAKPEEIGDLSASEPLPRDGYTLSLENPREATILSYRHDPGVPLLYTAIIAFIAGLAIRTYWPSYRVSLWIVPGAGGAVEGRLAFRATGMLGEPDDIEAALVRELEAGG